MGDFNSQIGFNAANGRNALGRRDSVSLKSRVVVVFGSLQSPLGHAF